MNNIEKCMEEIREIVNYSPLYDELQKNTRSWRKLCASMDTIEDTESAILLYERLPSFSGMNGEYLYLYGLFQVLYVQQDSVNSLYHSLFGEKLEIQTIYPNIKEVRDTRDDLFGHPTERNYDERSHVISRPTISNKSFDVLDYYTDSKKDTFRTIDIFRCINKQREDIKNILKKIHTGLEEKNKELKAKVTK